MKEPNPSFLGSSNRGQLYVGVRDGKLVIKELSPLTTEAPRNEVHLSPKHFQALAKYVLTLDLRFEDGCRFQE